MAAPAIPLAPQTAAPSASALVATPVDTAAAGTGGAAAVAVPVAAPTAAAAQAALPGVPVAHTAAPRVAVDVPVTICPTVAAVAALAAAAIPVTAATTPAVAVVPVTSVAAVAAVPGAVAATALAVAAHPPLQQLSVRRDAPRPPTSPQRVSAVLQTFGTPPSAAAAYGSASHLRHALAMTPPRPSPPLALTPPSHVYATPPSEMRRRFDAAAADVEEEDLMRQLASQEDDWQQAAAAAAPSPSPPRPSASQSVAAPAAAGPSLGSGDSLAAATERRRISALRQSIASVAHILGFATSSAAAQVPPTHVVIPGRYRRNHLACAVDATAAPVATAGEFRVRVHRNVAAYYNHAMDNLTRCAVDACDVPPTGSRETVDRATSAARDLVVALADGIQTTYTRSEPAWIAHLSQIAGIPVLATVTPTPSPPATPTSKPVRATKRQKIDGTYSDSE